MPNRTSDRPEDLGAGGVKQRRPTGTLRVLMANGPRAYRESLATVIGQLRPGVEMCTAEPDAMDGSIPRLSPDMVVCSKATDTLKSLVRVWIELYPGHAAHSLASIDGRLVEYAEIQLSDLLSIVDRAKELVWSD